MGNYSGIIMIVLLFAVFYFFLIRPENKKKKKLQEMRTNLQVGDQITTIGGIVGKIVSIKDDMITFETGEDRDVAEREYASGAFTVGGFLII